MIQKEVGISVYPDRCSLEFCLEKIDRAADLGYKKIFTGFTGDHTKVKLTDEYTKVFSYAREKGMEFHVDFNNLIMESLGMSSSDLKLAADVGISVLRVDCGITDEEIVEMTKNPYGIKIEENLSNIRTLEYKMELISGNGNINNYCACHNFYPRINSGLDINYAIECAKIAKRYHCQTGAFIGSLYSSPALVENGRGTMTIEKHRYLPSHIQAYELFSSEVFDFLIFGDANPTTEELEAVAKTTRNAFECLCEEDKDRLTEKQKAEYKNIYCVQLPVYFEPFDKINDITKLVMRNRIDVCEEAIRVMNWRGKCIVEPMNTVPRYRGCITMDNKYNDSYSGEIEILLKDMPAVNYTNVIGMVKPYAYELIDIIREGRVMFQFTKY